MSLSLNHDVLLKDVTHYWNNRAEGYSQSNQEELQSENRSHQWQQTILSYAPTTEQPLKILDIGTGPGFFAIIMAQAEHKVTAIDATTNMLEQAQQNAQNAGVEINFVQGDVHHLPFDAEQFDLVITRNVTWNLDQPIQAYQEWHRVLKTGGRLVNFDANWYLYLYDEQRKVAFEQDRLNTQQQNIPDHYINTDTVAMENIARGLPLSRELRPNWDANVLLNIGFSDLVLDTKIGEHLWSEEEKVNYRSTPMFMIVARK